MNCQCGDHASHSGEVPVLVRRRMVSAVALAMRAPPRTDPPRSGPPCPAVDRGARRCRPSG